MYISIKQQLLSLTCISDDHDRYLPLREVIIYPFVQSRYVLQNRVRQNNGSQLEWPVVRVASIPAHVILSRNLGMRLVKMVAV